MEKIIKIDLNNKYDFIDKYNEDNVSIELIEYIIKQAVLINKDEKIKIEINNKCCVSDDCKLYIKEGLKRQYSKSIEEYNNNNLKQLIFLILGTIFIFLSTLIPEELIWNEVLLIIGWVPIWEMIEVELFLDVDGRKRRKIIKKLLESEIIVNSSEE